MTDTTQFETRLKSILKAAVNEAQAKTQPAPLPKPKTPRLRPGTLILGLVCFLLVFSLSVGPPPKETTYHKIDNPGIEIKVTTLGAGEDFPQIKLKLGPGCSARPKARLNNNNRATDV